MAVIAAFGLVTGACASDDAADAPSDTEAAPAVTEEPVATDAPGATDAPVVTEAPEEPATTTTEAPAPPTEPFDVSMASLVGTPSQTNSMNGVNVSPVDGNVYVASVGGNEITVHDPETGEILDRIGSERGVNGPDDVYITDDGTVYWTDLLAGNVGMLAPDGTVTTQAVGPGVNPITMSDDGRLFVARIFLGDGLYELDPMLIADPIPLDETLVGLNAFDFGPDGLLYAPSFFTGDVLRIDVDADVIEPEIVASGFGVSSAVKFDSTGVPHVVSIGEGKVFALDLESGEQTELIDIVGTIDNIAFDADDRLFVIAGVDNQIIRIDGDETTVLNEPGLGSPGGVAVTPDGTVWVADFFGMSGFLADDLTTPAFSYYDTFLPPGAGFASATTAFADGDDLVIGGLFSGAVQVIDPVTGELSEDIRSVPVPINAIRHGDRLVIASGVPAGVVDADDPTTSLIDELILPVGLASDGTTLYVGDWATGIIWAVTEDGAEMLVGELAFPEGMTLDGDRLLVVETGAQQVTAVDLATGEKSPVITGLDYSATATEGFLPIGIVSGVAVGPDGAIYVTDDGVNSVYRFER